MTSTIENLSFPLTVVILARNEQQNIGRCVGAVRWCSEVVVIDDGSTDQTVQIAEAAGARVLQHKFESFAAQRNWAMERASLRNEWVLHLDADEVMTPELQKALMANLSEVPPEVAAFRMCRKTMLSETWLKYSDGFPVWIMRLVKRGQAQFVSSGHGEVAVPTVDGVMGTIREPFLHFAFSKGWADWIERHNRYSSREAMLEEERDHTIAWDGLISFDKAQRRAALRGLSRQLPFRSLFRFLYQYLFKLGFLDGRAGYTFCRMMAIYEYWIVLKRCERRREITS